MSTYICMNLHLNKCKSKESIGQLAEIGRIFNAGFGYIWNFEVFVHSFIRQDDIEIQSCGV